MTGRESAGSLQKSLLHNPRGLSAKSSAENSGLTDIVMIAMRYRVEMIVDMQETHGPLDFVQNCKLSGFP